MNWGLWNYLTAITLALEVVFATCAAIHVGRVMRQSPVPLANEVNAVPTVLGKLRKGVALQDYEKPLANQVVDARRPLLAFSIPATFMTAGAFYIFGSLEHLHGAQPSERTYLGLIPIITSTNLTMRMFLSGKLKSRIDK
ncbi:hypothetical protein [Mycobacterium paraterrae]|uniref:Membrane protein insertase YidC n=1 Tax=Mycobacterium paraterrae TaxID=577492 RepID=A0ABY3VKQ5_9MYCO|nr:hypothetical protein [Mycobacterium paraterrae]UMB69052.1 hypothetical protein MKK62_22165 [Mycobacterium paraterrae]